MLFIVQVIVLSCILFSNAKTNQKNHRVSPPNHKDPNCPHGIYYRQGCEACYCFKSPSGTRPKQICESHYTDEDCGYWAHKSHCDERVLDYNYNDRCEGHCECIVDPNDDLKTITTCKYLPCHNRILEEHKILKTEDYKIYEEWDGQFEEISTEEGEKVTAPTLPHWYTDEEDTEESTTSGTTISTISGTNTSTTSGTNTSTTNGTTISTTSGTNTSTTSGTTISTSSGTTTNTTSGPTANTTSGTTSITTSGTTTITTSGTTANTTSGTNTSTTSGTTANTTSGTSTITTSGTTTSTTSGTTANTTSGTNTSTTSGTNTSTTSGTLTGTSNGTTTHTITEPDCNPWDPDCDAKKPIDWDDDPDPLPDRERYTNQISKDCQRGNFFRQGCRICYCFPKSEMSYPSSYCVDLVSRPACTYWADKVHCEDPKLLHNYSKKCEGTCKCIHGDNVHGTYTTCRYLPCFDKILAFHKRYTTPYVSKVTPEGERDATLDGTEDNDEIERDATLDGSEDYDEDNEDMDVQRDAAFRKASDDNLFIVGHKKRAPSHVKTTKNPFPLIVGHRKRSRSHLKATKDPFPLIVAHRKRSRSHVKPTKDPFPFDVL